MKFFIGRFGWIYLLVIFLIIITSAILVQIFRSTSDIAKWVYDFVNDWAAALSASAALLLVLLGFITIKETRRRSALTELRDWTIKLTAILLAPPKNSFPTIAIQEFKETLLKLRVEGRLITDASPLNRKERTLLETVFVHLSMLIDEVGSHNRNNKVEELISLTLTSTRTSMALIS